MKQQTTVAYNKTAFNNYYLEDTFEAEISLQDNEVLAIKSGRIDLENSYVEINDKEAFLMGCNIPGDEYVSDTNYDPCQPRKIDFRKNKTIKLLVALSEGGHTILPTRVYFIKNKVGIEIALGKSRNRTGGNYGR